MLDPSFFGQNSWIFGLSLLFLGGAVVNCRRRLAPDKTGGSHTAQNPDRATANDRLLADTQNRLAQLTALLETSRAVVSTLDLDELLKLIIQQAVTLLQAEGGILNLADWVKQEDEVVACIGSTGETLGVKAPLNESLSGWVTLHNQPQISNRIQEDTRTYEYGRRRVITKQLTNAALAPLSIKDRAIGTLVVVDKLGGSADFDQSDLDLLVGFASQAAAAIENARLYATERRRAEQFQAVSEVSRRLTLILDVDEVLKQLVRVIRQIFRYYHVGIGLIEGDEVVYRFGSGVLWDDPDFQYRPSRLKVGEEGISGWVAANGRPFLVPDVDKEPQYVNMKGSTTRSELVVPIFMKEKIIGVLDAQSDQVDAFDETDQLVLQSLAHQAGAVIENARLFHAEQRRAEQFRVISEVGRQILSVTAVNELLQQMALLIQQSFDYYHVGIGLIEDQEVVSKAEAGACAEAYRNARIPLGHGAWGWTAQHGQVLMQPNVHVDARFMHESRMGAIQSHLCVPMRTKDAVIGVISVASDRLDAFDASDETVLQSLAQQAAVAIENIRFYERAQEVAVLEERSRLARELHDAVTQTLFSASLIAEAVPSVWESDPKQGGELLQDLRSLSRGALAEMRTLLLELRPAALAETRLDDLLRQLGEAAAGRLGIPVDVNVQGQGSLPPEVHIALYRIAQEAVNNVVKHARSSKVEIKLSLTGAGPGAGHPASRQRAQLAISDNGRGFDPALAPHHRLGLGIMQERAQAIGAALSVDSHPGKGTRVSLLWERGGEGKNE